MNLCMFSSQCWIKTCKTWQVLLRQQKRIHPAISWSFLCAFKVGILRPPGSEIRFDLKGVVLLAKEACGSASPSHPLLLGNHVYQKKLYAGFFFCFPFLLHYFSILNLPMMLTSSVLKKSSGQSCGTWVYAN